MLEGTDGVISADASFITGQAVVTYDSEATSPEALVAAINTRTFYRAWLPSPDDERVEPASRQITLAFQREFDPARAWQIGTTLKALQGVTDVNALPDGRVSVAFDPERVDPKRVIGAVEEMGYGVVGVEGPSPLGGDARWRWSFVYG